MPGHAQAHSIGGLVTLFVLTIVVPTYSQSGATCPDCNEVIARVLRLLPSPAPRITVVDHAPPAPGHSLRKVDAFVVAGDRTVYIVKRGTTFQHALRDRGIWEYAMAIVIWHEMAHLAGANEQEAQLREEDLWRQFLVARKVDAGTGLKYLQLMTKRRPNYQRSFTPYLQKLSLECFSSQSAPDTCVLKTDASEPRTTGRNSPRHK